MSADPPLVGPDPLWTLVWSGKGHVYYALALIIVLSIAVVAGVPPRVPAAIVGMLAAGVFADLWAHLYGH